MDGWREGGRERVSVCERRMFVCARLSVYVWAGGCDETQVTTEEN
jgi:hypothetical protein